MKHSKTDLMANAVLVLGGVLMLALAGCAARHQQKPSPEYRLAIPSSCVTATHFTKDTVCRAQDGKYALCSNIAVEYICVQPVKK